MAILNRTTKQWQEIDSAHHLHPFTDYKSLAEEGSIIISKADGVHLTNSDGKQLLDAMSGLWCVNIGYGRKSMADVAYQQMQELPYYNSFFKTANVPSIELSRQLAEITPQDLNYAFFSSSGSEANDTVVRMIKRYWDLKNQPTKKTFISREYAYHGSTMIGVSLGGMTGMHDQGGLLPGFSHIMPPYWYKYGEDMSHQEFGLYAANKLEERILELGAENIAAFIGEPIQGAGGVIIPPDNYWLRFQEICKKYDILLVVDEVICGFGRTGNWFGSDTYNIKPDIITMAKGISSGYIPLSGIMVGNRVTETLVDEGGEFYHGYTYSGHPLACAAGLATLKLLKRENVFEKVKEMAPILEEKVHGLKGSRHIQDIRNYGSAAGITLKSHDGEPAKRPYEAAMKCWEKGFYVRYGGDTLQLGLPFSSTDLEIDSIVNAIGESLSEID